MPSPRLRVVAVLLLVIVAPGCSRPRRKPAPLPVPIVVPTPVPTPTRSVESVVEAIGPRVRAAWEPHFVAAGLAYPPAELALLGFKRERRLEVWGRTDGPWKRIDALPIVAASGIEGPKLRQGDGQVPEGFYRLVAFNPNSRFHLSMMIDYPNAEDVALAEGEGRTDLGGDIFIHGDARSIGCLAMGDRAIEDLFVLVADVGLERVQVILAPRDPRGGVRLAPVPGVWFTADLYRRIEAALAAFR
jgi:hypothetical protein